VYGAILKILMRPEETSTNIQKAIDYLYVALDQLIEGKVAMDKLTITRALKSDYKNPMQIGHWVLAERIGARDPGNKPKPGDRMKYVFIVNPHKKALTGDKIETPEYIVANNLQIDYTHYITNQLMKPLQQLFGLALEPIWTNQKKMAAIKNYKKDMVKLEEETPDMEAFMKKKEKYCSAKIKALLFDKFLDKIEHQRTGMRTITSMFG
jgi:DNA polymerase delta subunit 1